MATRTDEYDTRERQFSHDGDDRRSVIQLVKDLRDEMTDLLRQEVALAKSEMGEKYSRTLRNIAYLVIGGVILQAGLVVLLLAGAAGAYAGLVSADFTHYTAGWLGPLAVGSVVAIIGYALLQKALSTLKNETLVPEETVASLTRTKNWAQEKVS
jgi:hypothetical protein